MAKQEELLKFAWKQRSIFHTIVYPGEDLHRTIIRAAFEAGKNGFTGYSIDCEKCGQPVSDHETPQDCETWIREFPNYVYAFQRLCRMP